MEKTFFEAFNDWFQAVVKMINQHQSEINQYSAIELNEGRRYYKVVVNGAAWAFVDKQNGDILKPASWNAPAKHARGNVFDMHGGLKHVSAYGPAYMR